MELPEAIPPFHHPVPAGVGNKCGEDDRSDSFGYGEPEEQIKGGDEQQQYQQLAEVDSDIKGQQRRRQVSAGELESLAEGEGKSEPVYKAEADRADPAPPQGA